MENSPLEWEALEHHHDEKSNDWFWVVGIIAVSIAVTAVILSNIIFAIFVVIATVALVLQTARAPRVLRIHIDATGVAIDKTKYPYGVLESFWVNDEEHPPALLLKSKRFFLPLIVVRLEDMNVDEVHNYLDRFLHAEKLQEPLFQKIMEYLGF